MIVLTGFLQAGTVKFANCILSRKTFFSVSVEFLEGCGAPTPA